MRNRIIMLMELDFEIEYIRLNNKIKSGFCMIIYGGLKNSKKTYKP